MQGQSPTIYGSVVRESVQIRGDGEGYSDRFLRHGSYTTILDNEAKSIRNGFDLTWITL